MALVQIAHNATVAKLVRADQAVRTFVLNLLSYTADTGLGIGAWSGKSSFFDVNAHTFPAGFVHLVRTELAAVGHQVQIIAKPLPSPLGPESPIVDGFGNDDPRYDYQLKALRQVEKFGAGIIRVATGGGKSKIAKLVMQRFQMMTLFLTTRGILLYQMDDQLQELGLATGQIGDGEIRAVKGINLGMVQTLVQALQEPSEQGEFLSLVDKAHRAKSKASIDREALLREAKAIYERKVKRRELIIRFLELVQVVIGEEAHEAGGNSYFEILRHCKNARVRVALTATPFMREAAEDNMRLMAAFGPVLIDISEEMLIERGILAQPWFKYVNAEAPKNLFKTSPYERALQLGYLENEHMHAALVRDALKAKARALPILVLVGRKAWGEKLEEIYRKNGLRAVFLKGENDMKERKRALLQLQAGELDAIIGTTILDVGVDVPCIGLVQLAGGGKAEVALRQRIGRGLRSKKAPMPNIAFVADYSCNRNCHLGDHARRRETLVRLTPGFGSHILQEGEDFPWARFELKRAA